MICRDRVGATAGDIRRLVLNEGGRLALIGIGAGLLAAIVVSAGLTRFVFQISTVDPVTFVVASSLLGLAMLLATFVPAHRAARADPMKAHSAW